MVYSKWKLNNASYSLLLLQVNIEQDPEIVDPGTFGADLDTSFVRFEFNDYPSEVFYPNNDYYSLNNNNNNNNDQENNETDDKIENSTDKELKSGLEGEWIRKSFEQLTLQNPEPINRQKIVPRSKSLDSESRSNYDENDVHTTSLTTDLCDDTLESDCVITLCDDSNCDAVKCDDLNCDVIKCASPVCCDVRQDSVRKKRRSSKKRENDSTNSNVKQG